MQAGESFAVKHCCSVARSLFSQDDLVNNIGKNVCKVGRWLGGWIGSAILLNACTPALEMASVETAIQTDIEQQGRVVVAAIACPNRVERSPSHSFWCRGTLTTGETFFVQVEQHDDEGTVTWDVPHSKGLINLAKLEQHFEEVLNTAADTAADTERKVSCGGVYRVNRAGDSFECRVVTLPISADHTETVQVTLDPVGNVTWQQRIEWQQAAVPEGELASGSDRPSPPPEVSPAVVVSQPEAEPAQPVANPAPPVQTAEDFLDSLDALDGFD